MTIGATLHRLCVSVRPIVLVFVASAASGEMSPAHLFCEYASNPLGVDTPRPRLGWSFESATKRGERQTAYQVLVASSEENLKSGRADLWDSGKVVSDDNIQVAYGGTPLPSDATCYWKVRVWDQHAGGGTCSNMAHFDTGLRTPADWKNAAWIAWRPDEAWRRAWEARKAKELAPPIDPNEGWIYPKSYPRQADFTIFRMWHFHKIPYDPAPLFRRDFVLDKPIRRARAYICGLGYYELHLNGHRVGDRLLDPAWMDPAHHVCYVTYDVTDQLRKGGNTVGIMLGRGLENPLVDDVWGFSKESRQPKVLFRLSVEYADRTRTDIISQPGWKVTGSPVVFDDPYRGEIYDARKEIAGWDKSGINDAPWDAAVTAPAPEGALVGQMIPPIRATEEIHPVAVASPQPGVYVFDLGHAIAGWPRLKISGPAGTEILVRYSDRNLLDAPLPAAKSFLHPQQQHGFILKGRGIESLEPRFCFTSFRYAVVSGAPGPLTVDDLVGMHVHTDLANAGEFECSNPLINKIHRTVRLTLLNNTHGVISDCLTREKHGWTCVGDLTSHEATLCNFDMATFYEKRMEDICDGQYANGVLAPWVPHPHNGDFYYAYTVAAAAGMPWNEYVYYGDRRILETHYGAIKRAVDAMADVRVDGDRRVGGRRVETEPDVVYPYIVNDYSSDCSHPMEGQPFTIKAWADHPYSHAKEGNAIYGTAWFYYSTQTLEHIARVLRKEDDAARYAALAPNIQKGFEHKFYDPERKCYRGEVRDITEYRQSADAVPLYYGLVPDERRAAIVGNLLANLTERKDRLNTGYLGSKALMEVLPAYGAGEEAYRVAVQTEFPSWGWLLLGKGYTTFTEAWEGGLDHTNLTSVGSYFFRWLGGIQPDPEHPGFRHFSIRPTFVAGLDFVRATYRCPSGLIESQWKRQDGRLTLVALVPPNTTATITVPAADAGMVTESGRPAAQARGVKLVRAGDGAAVFEVQSGSYRFEMPERAKSNTAGT